MHVVVIGGTGHIGTYLVPRLVREGADVTVIARRRQNPYVPDPAWSRVRFKEIDRVSAETQGTFGSAVAALDPHVVIDIISFTEASTRQLVEALRGRVQHFLHCGTIWVKGHLNIAPMHEDTPSDPVGAYGVHKRAIADYLLDEARRGHFPATMIDPGHIVGPGHTAINPLGNHNPVVFSRLARGERLPLPHFGMDLLHHVHADDVAQVFTRAMSHWSVSVGESFFAVSPAAVTTRGYAEEVSRWFGRTAALDFLPWDEWATAADLPPGDIEMSRAHFSHGQCCSIEKATRLLGYRPRYSSFEAIREAVDWLIAKGTVSLGAAQT